MDKEEILLKICLETLHTQDQYLNEIDKKDFPLMFRAISSVNDIWNSSLVPIRKLEIETITPDMVRIQVNEYPPVTYITFEKVPGVIVMSNEAKLIGSGYRLFRIRDYTGPGFTYQNPRYDICVWDLDSGTWRLFEKGFPSKAARENRMKEILMEEKNLLC